MRDLYWRKLYKFRFELEYYYLCFSRCLKVRRLIQITTAVVSSAAIGAWVTWTNLAFVWGCIIVISQVVTAIYDVLPIKKRTDALSGLISQAELLYYEIEDSWRKIDIQNYSDEKINTLLTNYEAKWVITCNKALAGDILPQSEKLRDKAERDADAYLKIFE